MANEILHGILKHFLKYIHKYEGLKAAGNHMFPFTEHVNIICNDKIKNMPEDFKGIFLVEESYYTTDGKNHSSPQLFLFAEQDKGIVLTSYEIPEGYNKNTFTYTEKGTVDFADLKKSEKFTLFERFSEEQLEVSESMERD